MHRIDTKKRRAAALRYVAYGITLTLSVATTVILLFVAQGYRIDRTSGEVVKSGLLLVDNRPASAAVYVNDVQRDSSAPSRFVLNAGSYKLDLKREGYKTWSKVIAVPAGSVVEALYPLLVPENFETKQLQTVDQPKMISQSHDRKNMLVQQADGALLLVAPSLKETKVTALSPGPALKREANAVGTLSVVEWSLNNKFVLLRQALPSGTEGLYVLEVAKPAEIVDLTARTSLTAAQDPHFVGDKTDQFYGLVDQTVRRYNADSGVSENVLTRVRSYTPYGDDTILFARTAQDGTTLESGVYKDGSSVVVDRAKNAAAGTALLQYGEYEDAMYFAVSPSVTSTTTIYRNPLKKPVLANQLPLKKIEGIQPKQFKLSGSGQFLLTRSGRDVIVYDFDQLKSHAFSLPVEVAEGDSVRWLDDHHLLATDVAGMNHMIDFDGTNVAKLQPSLAGTSLYFANDYKSFYRFTESAGSFSLNGSSMLTAKDQ